MQGLRAVVGHALLHIPAVTAVPVRPDGSVLLGRHADTGRWGSIGGAVELGESPREAVEREVLEELGVTVASAHIVGAYGGPDLQVTYPNGDQVAFVTTAYVVHLDSDDFDFPDGELLEAQWFAPVDVVELRLSRWLGEVLSDVAAFLSPSAS